MKKNNPLLWASLISTMWRERNPFVLLLKDIQHQLQIMIQLRQNLAASKKRIEKLEKQSNQIATLIEEGRPNKTGYNINTFK